MKKKILIISWRDPKSPLEGGAERFTRKYGEYWAKKGHSVYWLTNTFFKAERKEMTRGIIYLRIGPQLDGSLFKYIFFYPLYLLNTILFAHEFIKQEKIDLVIDEIHGLPFFTPLFSKARNVLLTCEVAGTIWNKMFPWPLNLIGRNIERLIYQIYEKTEIWAISENTKKNISDLTPKAKVKIIPLGIEDNKKILELIKNIKKTKYPSVVFLARLVKMKGIETAIEATAKIAKELPNFKLFIIGEGKEKYIRHLKVKIKKLHIKQNVEFLGKISELDKFTYLKKVHFLLHPSYKEGFGLTVVEAGLVKTPAIIRTGSSLDALVTDGASGFSFKNKDQIVKMFLENYKNKEYNKIANQAWKKAKQYLWDDILETSKKITRIY